MQIISPYVTRNPVQFHPLRKQKPCTFMSPFRSGVGEYSSEKGRGSCSEGGKEAMRTGKGSEGREGGSEDGKG